MSTENEGTSVPPAPSAPPVPVESPTTPAPAGSAPPPEPADAPTAALPPVEGAAPGRTRVPARPRGCTGTRRAARDRERGLGWLAASAARRSRVRGRRRRWALLGRLLPASGAQAGPPAWRAAGRGGRGGPDRGRCRRRNRLLGGRAQRRRWFGLDDGLRLGQPGRLQARPVLGRRPRGERAAEHRHHRGRGQRR